MHERGPEENASAGHVRWRAFSRVALPLPAMRIVRPSVRRPGAPCTPNLHAPTTRRRKRVSCTAAAQDRPSPPEILTLPPNTSYNTQTCARHAHAARHATACVATPLALPPHLAKLPGAVARRQALARHAAGRALDALLDQRLLLVAQLAQVAPQACGQRVEGVRRGGGGQGRPRSGLSPSPTVAGTCIAHGCKPRCCVRNTCTPLMRPVECAGWGGAKRLPLPALTVALDAQQRLDSCQACRAHGRVALRHLRVKESPSSGKPGLSHAAWRDVRR